MLAGMGTLASGAVLSGTVAGESPPEASDGKRPTETAKTGPDEPAAAIESLVADTIDTADIAGAAVAVVHDGEVVLSDGYGVTDDETDRPVEPTTPFRIASVTKPVVCTAIAEIVARGDVDVDTPVATYLDDALVSWDDPVTLANLVTHTGGFELTNRNLWYPSPDDVGPLPKHLDPMPTQVRSPGTLGSYSNHGIALAGQVLAEAVGDPFHEALETVLFEPAEMTTASIAQPLPAALYESHATGQGAFGTAGKLSGIGISPAGAASASAADMVRFIQLHLNRGEIDGEQVLSPEAIELSHQQWFTHHDAIPGMAFGFVEAHHSGARVLQHDGASPYDGFTSELRIVPEHDIGVFTAYNDNGLELDLADTILNELLPTPQHDPPDPTTPHRADELSGTYRILRYGTNAHDSLLTTVNAPTVEVELADDGALLVDDGDERARWIEIEPLVFEREDDADERLAFGDHEGTIEHLFLGGTPSAFVKTDWHESTMLHGGLALGGLFGLSWAYSEWKPDRSYTESRREWLASTRSNSERLATATAWAGATAFLAFLLVTIGYLLVGQSRFMVGYLTDPSAVYTLAYALPVVGAGAAVVALVLALYAWPATLWDRRRRLLYGATALLLLVMTAFHYYWNFFLP